jgi:hypothetical protein
MNVITNIRYVDAGYVTTPNLSPSFAPSVYEVYGYVQPLVRSILVRYVTLIPSNMQNVVIEGLVLPMQAVESRHIHVDTSTYAEVLPNTRIVVVWYDVVHLTHATVRECHTMRTEGFFERVAGKHIIIREPKTIRIEPEPVKVHARDATYLSIPIGCIHTHTYNA